MPPPRKAYLAFTLSEVLITLGIIGVVAALTLPALINSHRAIQYEVGFKTAQSLLGQAVNELHTKDIYIYGNIDYKPNLPFSNIFAEAFSGINALNSYKAGFDGYAKYKTYSNTPFNHARLDDGSCQLTNGMSVYFESGTRSTTTTPIVIFDLNGSKNKPNRFGYDTFAFIVDEYDKVYPLGSSLATSAKYKLFTDLSRYCNKNSTSEENGISCAYEAATQKDYFKNHLK